VYPTGGNSTEKLHDHERRSAGGNASMLLSSKLLRFGAYCTYMREKIHGRKEVSSEEARSKEIRSEEAGG